MNEQTAHFLITFGNRWPALVWSLPIISGVAVYGSGQALELRRIANSSRRGLFIAKTARVLSQAWFGLSLALLIVLFMDMPWLYLAGREGRCFSNLKVLAAGALLYAQDNDGRLPPSKHWSEAIDARVRGVARMQTPATAVPFKCPSAESPASYGMNAGVDAHALAAITAPDNTVLFFETDAPIRSFAGNAGDVAGKRHDGRPHYAFADGHVASRDAARTRTLIWTPSASDGTHQTRKAP